MQQQYVIQDKVSFSKLATWDHLARTYANVSHENWLKGHVPGSNFSSSRYLAENYFEVILGYIQDWLGEHGQDGPQAATKTFYVVELGSGSGKFAYHFSQCVQKNETLLKRLGIRLCLVITELDPSHLSRLKEIACLKPFYESGLLDVALFNAATISDATEITTEIGKRTLTQADFENMPLMLIGNYVLNALPHDLFFAKNKQPFAGLTTLKSNSQTINWQAKKLEKSLEFSYEQGDQCVRDYYNNEELDDLLFKYSEVLDNGCFLFPKEALNMLAYFRHLANDHLLFLSGDIGMHSLGKIRSYQSYPAWQWDNSTDKTFCVTIDYLLLENYFSTYGFKCAMPSQYNTVFGCYAFIGGIKKFARTAEACRKLNQLTGSIGFMHDQDDKFFDKLPFRSLLQLLAMYHYDSSAFYKLFQFIRPLLSRISTDEQIYLNEVLLEVHQQAYYPVERNLFYDIGILLSEGGLFEQSLVFFKQAMGSNPESKAGCLDFIAFANYSLRRKNDALSACTEALLINKHNNYIASLQGDIEAEL